MGEFLHRSSDKLDSKRVRVQVPPRTKPSRARARARVRERARACACERIPRVLARPDHPQRGARECEGGLRHRFARRRQGGARSPSNA
eukprot:311649-Pleurochrysis_carterae.AAC.2